MRRVEPETMDAVAIRGVVVVFHPTDFAVADALVVVVFEPV